MGSNESNATWKWDESFVNTGFFSPTLSAQEKNFSKNLFSKSNIEVCICDTKIRMERLINNACC